MVLASDLRWLINEGYIIEFNDGSLDLPRAKAKPKEETTETAVPAAESEDVVAATDEPPEDVVAAVVPTDEAEQQAGGAGTSSTAEGAGSGCTETRPNEERTENGGS